MRKLWITGEKEIKIDVVKLALSVQLAVFGLVGLDVVGVNIPILNEVTVFVYLTLIPGVIILKILRVNIDFIRILLISIGISLSIFTFLSTLESIILAPFCEEPLSKLPLAIFLGSFILSLTLFCWNKERHYSFSLNSFSPIYFFLIILPFFIVTSKAIGDYTLISIALIIISALPITVLLSNTNEKAYPLIIWIMSLSVKSLKLIFEHKFNMRFDDQTPIITEAIKIAGIWDPHFPVTHNSLLFPSIFPSVFSILSGIDIAVGARIVSCFLYSLIPVILYMIYKDFFHPPHAFLAASLYIFYPFYLIYFDSLRTGFGFLFVSLFLLLLLSREINLKSKSLLLIIFAFSLITSHYGTAYLFLFLLIPILVLYFYEKRFRDFKGKFISPTFFILFVTMAFSWYIYTSGAQNFNWGVGFGNHIITNLKEFFSPEESAAIRAFVTETITPSLSLKATKWLLLILLIFIIIGAVKLLYLYIKNKVDAKYAILMFAFCLVLLGITQMGMPRILGFSLLFTAPLAIWGLSEVLRFLHIKEKNLLFFSIYLFILFAFASGIVANTINAITGEVKDMSLISVLPNAVFKENIMECDNLHFKRLIYWGWEPDSTIKATAWFFIHKNPERRIYVDSLVADSHLFTLHLPREYGGKIVCNLTQPRTSGIEKVLKGGVRDGYVFLAYHNIHDNFIFVVDRKGNETYYKTSDYQNIFGKMNMIYNSDGGVICHAG